MAHDEKRCTGILALIVIRNVWKEEYMILSQSKKFAYGPLAEMCLEALTFSTKRSVSTVQIKLSASRKTVGAESMYDLLPSGLCT